MAAYIGIDVGTGSVRAALVSDIGQILHTSVLPIKIHNPQQDFYEQSSTNIWGAVCHTVKEVLKKDEKKHQMMLHVLWSLLDLNKGDQINSDLGIKFCLVYFILHNCDLIKYLIKRKSKLFQ